MATRLSVSELAAQLLYDGRHLARSEVRLAKAKITSKVASVRTGAILFAAAAIVTLLGLVGLVVGLVLALSLVVNAAVAGLIVLVGALAIAGLLAWLGSRALSSPKSEGRAS